MPTVKEQRWNLRVSPGADTLVREAATLIHRNLTDFVIDAAVSEAERLLADRTRFSLDSDRWEAFVNVLDRPVTENPRLARLFEKPDVFV